MTKLNYAATHNCILQEEQKLTLQPDLIIEEAKHMTSYLSNILFTLKDAILKDGFNSIEEEIYFFKHIKPQILAKVIYYNKIYRIETSSPIYPNVLLENYYQQKIDELMTEFKIHANKTDFYRYYKSHRTDRDLLYFTLGNINFLNGMNSFIFEIDPLFSTYYDYKIARILSSEMLYNYFLLRLCDIQNITNCKTNENILDNALQWSESQNALIELIYALYASKAINNGNLEIRKIAVLFQGLFDINLIDIHHAFHRMKTRAKSRTSYLDKLKVDLEKYMDRE